MMAAALTLAIDGDTSRDLYLYDTYEGMPAATDNDRDYLDQSRECKQGAGAASLKRSPG
jgi:hypothetical protein